MRITITVIFLTLFFIKTNAQLRINEGSNKNYTQVTSPSGEFGDWIELYNAGNSSINLTGYFLSDDVSNPFKWNFPATSLSANSFLLLFANGNGIPSSVNHWETAVYDSSLWRYFVPVAPLPADWNLISFDASSWLQGMGGFGFGDGDDSTVIPNGNISVYTIIKFMVPDVSKILSAQLHMDYDDGFVAYLNGTEIARSNLTGTPPAWNELAFSHEAKMYSGGVPETFAIDSALLFSVLTNDTNVLAIEVHNVSAGNGDLTSRSFLSFGIKDTSTFFNQAPYFVTETIPATLETNFKIDVDGEMIYLSTISASLIDSLFIGNLDLDFSAGKFPDGDSAAGTFAIATPGSSNNSSLLYSGYEAAPEISPAAGFYSASQLITITSVSPTAEIRYTTNGGAPSSSSQLYSVPFSLDSTHVVKARCFSTTGLLASATTTKTFLINENFSLPVISITTDSLNLWGLNGICDNWWSDWKKPCYIEYFDTTGNNDVFQSASIKIDGGAGGSRSNPQHSFRIDADNEIMGDGPIPYTLISSRPKRNEYESIYLRNGSNQYLGMFYKDALECRVFRDMNCNYQEYTPVIAYLNGEYWGVYELREKQDEGYFKHNYNTDPDSLDLLSLSYWYYSELRTLAGSDDDFYTMRNTVVYSDPLSPDYYAQSDSLLDLKAYADYVIAETYIGNYDWPQNNIKIWRSKNTSNKWRFGLIDLELSLPPNGWSNTNSNLIAYVLGYDTSNLFISPFQTLVINKQFHDYFIDRYADMLNTEFQKDSIDPVGDIMYNEVVDDMPRNYERWGDTINSTVAAYMGNLLAAHSSFINAIKPRTNNVRKHIKNEFLLTDTVGFALDVFPALAGKIQISTIKPPDYPWFGIYYEDVPVTLTAIANPGFLFSHWSANNFIDDTTLQTITVLATQAADYTAIFIATAPSKILVSEFNYNSEPSVSSGDWIEIYNGGADAVELTDWYLKDDDHDHKFDFPSSKLIQPGEYLAVAADTEKFKAQHPLVYNWVGPLSFGLSSSGDQIRLFTPLDELAESISYTNSQPWPIGAAGEGRTAERLNADQNANDPLNWFDGCIGGSPGTAYYSCNNGIIISEINYNSGLQFATKDWIELRNISSQQIDISDWVFKNSSDTNTYTIPTSTIIQPHSNLVLARTVFDFLTVHPDIPNVIGDFNFNLNGGDDWLRLYDATSALAISVHFFDTIPFPTLADGDGYTLELADSLGKMNDGTNWFAGCIGGSPGKYYTYPCDIALNADEVKPTSLYMLTPTISNGELTLQYNTQDDDLSISFFDLTGRNVYSKSLAKGNGIIKIETKNWPEGIFICNISSQSKLVWVTKIVNQLH